MWGALRGLLPIIGDMNLHIFGGQCVLYSANDFVSVYI